MSVLLDIIFSSFLGGVICLITLNANMVIREAAATYSSDLMVQEMLISTAQLVEGEFRNMGSGIDNGAAVISEARDTCIQFWTSTGATSADSAQIKYYVGSAAEVASMDNPDDRFLYRQFNADAPQRVGLVSQFHLGYFDGDGKALITPVVDEDDRSTIKIIEITMEVQSPYAAFLSSDPSMTKRYTRAMWKQTRLASQNLNR